MTKRGDRLPWYARVLLASFRGEGAEYARGDLEESYPRRNGSSGAHARWLLDVVLSLLAWWNPNAVRRRWRLGSRPAQGGLRDVTRDVRWGVRGLVRRPAFAAIAITTFGIGIAAPATIYSVVDAVLVKGLPYADAEELVVLGQTIPGREWVEDSELNALIGMSGPAFRDWREQSRTVTAMEAVERRTLLVPDEENAPYLVRAANATSGLFDLLGARLHAGRQFDASDMRGDAAKRVVIMSYPAWMRRTGGDVSIIGSAGPGFPGSIVIGVLAEEFELPETVFGRDGVEFWMPLDLDSDRYADRADARLQALGRLARGATVEQARAELSTIHAALARVHYPPSSVYEPPGAGVNSLEAQTVGTTGRTLWLFFAAAMLLLVIAAMNTANLLFVRGLDRHREMAVRMALGASTWRVARSVLTESVILAVAGGILGLALAWAGVSAFVNLVPDSMPRLADIALNGRILAIGAATSIGVGVIAGLAPALRSGRHHFAAHRAEGATEPRAGLRLRMGLVSAQLALAVVLGIGATLLFRSFVNVATADPGFDPENLTAFTIGMKRGPMEAGISPGHLWDELLEEVRKVPGVTAGAASSLPFQTPVWVPAFQLPEEDARTRRPVDAAYVITPDYFAVLGTSLVDGRSFNVLDVEQSQPVAIVNETFVRAYLGRAAVGRRIRVWEQDGSGTEREIVGVVADMVQVRVEDGRRPALYVPHTQSRLPFMWVVVRSTRDATQLAGELREAGRRFNPIVPAPDIERVSDRIRTARAEPRFQAILFLSFAGVAIGLAAVGLYGTLAHTVGRRTRELGIRMAVGADRNSIFRLVLREGAMVFGAGLLVGIALSMLLTRLLRRFLFGVGPLDVTTFAVTSIVLAAIAGVAMHRPARRATSVDPLRSLRAD